MLDPHLFDFFRRLLVGTLVVLGAVAIVLIVWFQTQVLLLGFAGMLLAVFLYTIAEFISRQTRLPYWASLIITCVLIFGSVIGILIFSGDQITQQAQVLAHRLPDSWEQVRIYLQQRAWGEWLLERGVTVWDEAQVEEILRRGFGVFSAAGVVLAQAVVVLLIGLFGAASPQLYIRGVMRLIPPARRKRAREVFEALGSVMWWWLIGQLVAMLFVGISSAIVLMILGVPLAMTLAVITFFLEAIPNFGPLIAAVPAILLALQVGPFTAFWVAISYWIIQQMESHLVTPLVQQRAVHLPPVVLILSQVFMYLWMGLLGMILAPPIAAVIMTIVQMIYVNDTLGDKMVENKGFWTLDAQ